jgi:hypothetical protein
MVLLFSLGNVYLAQNVADSAAIAYKSGLNAKKEAHLNYIGLGQLDLDNNKLLLKQTLSRQKMKCVKGL